MQNQNDMPWQFWGIFKGHGLNHQVTGMPHFFLGEGFWKQDLVKHPPQKKAKKKCIRKKTPKKNGSEKKHPTKLMDPPKTFLSESWRNSAGSGIQTPPSGRWLCQLQRLWRCERYHSGCFHCSWVNFFRKKHPFEVGFGNTEAKALEGLIETKVYEWLSWFIFVFPPKYRKFISFKIKTW